MPKDSAELPAYFDSVENLCKLYDMPKDVKSELFVAQLTGKPKSIVSTQFTAQFNDYLQVRSCYLTEFQLSPTELRSRFVSAAKLANESYSAFRARIEMLLVHYLKARSANNDVDRLIDLIVPDKLKDCLPAELCSMC
jgi:hypothetical protein